MCILNLKRTCIGQLSLWVLILRASPIPTLQPWKNLKLQPGILREINDIWPQSLLLSVKSGIWQVMTFSEGVFSKLTVYRTMSLHYISYLLHTIELYWPPAWSKTFYLQKKIFVIVTQYILCSIRFNWRDCFCVAIISIGTVYAPISYSLLQWPRNSSYSVHSY